MGFGGEIFVGVDESWLLARFIDADGLIGGIENPDKVHTKVQVELDLLVSFFLCVARGKNLSD